MVLVATALASAQDFKVTGSVFDAQTGEVIPFASIRVKGTMTGAAVGADGTYSINVPSKDNSVLVFSFVGYKTMEVPVEGRMVVDCSLEPDATALEDVVVVAYGSAKREAMTGSVTSVQGEQLASVPVASVDKALSGKLAGVSITSSTGQPGATSTIRIRGTSSINASNGPLWVVDGIPVLTGDVSAFDAHSSLMTSINPNDIESITVLKDAAAAAVYGSRAANGVILVTTKSGKEGRATFEARAKYGIQWFQNDNGFRMMTGEELLGYQRQAIINAGLDPDDPSGSYYRPMSLLTNEQTNFIDHFTKLGQLQEYEITARGGTSKSKYYTSISFHDNDGIVYGTDYQRIQARANADYKLLNNLETGIRVNLAYTDQDNAPTDGFAYENPIFAGMHLLPWEPKYDENGDHYLFPSNSGMNPRASADWNEASTKTYRLNGTMYLKWEPVKNLVLETKNSVETVFTDQRNYYSEKAGYNNIVQNVKNQIFQLTTSNTANYANVFGGYHSFRALVGQEATKYMFSQDYYRADGVNPDIPYPNTADQTKTSISTSISRDAMLSFFGIVDYNYDNKYFAQATVRGDGSSLFGAKNKWGLFWSGSASWNISNEGFLADVKAIDLLKIRASYGLNGNNGISAYRAYGVYGSATYNGIAGMLPSSPENQELSWEKNETWNVGLDFGFFGRLRGSIDVYNRVTKDMLLNKSVPQTSGFSSNFMNTGSMANRGVEFQIDGDIIATNDILWNVGFNIAHNQTEILDLGGEDVIEAASWLHYKVGNSLYTYYLSDYYGVNPSNGEALWVTEDGKLTNDYNKARQYYAGSPEPKLVGGFNTTFTWKGLSLAAFFEYKWGNKILPMNECRYLHSDGAEMTMNQMADALNYWKKPGDTNCNPKPVAGNASNSADFTIDRWLQDGSYVRLKDVTLSYTLPEIAVKKLNIKGLRFYVSGLNLYTWSDVTAYDPEAGANGVVAAIYPFAKSVVGGIELTF
jgi:TonB-linked SusC/RagA family outer membrane protein